MPMRCLLFVPGNKDDMLAKALECAADVVVPDMEDSVPDGEKGAARRLIGDWLPRLAEKPFGLLPRVNPLSSEDFEDDIRAAAAPGVWGVSVGKVDTPGDVCAISAALRAAEEAAGLPVGRLRLVPWIESALAIEHCFEICSASERIEAVAFGGEDYTADLAIERLDDESNVRYARERLCNAARAANVTALDTPFFRFRDDDGLRASCAASRRIGFRGRFAIHPAQIATIRASYAADESELAEARRIVEAFEAAERKGRGSTSLDGRVIDVPVVKRARALLATADRGSKQVP